MLPIRSAPPPGGPGPRPLAGRVLVVDDERAVRLLFERILLMEGFDVIVASSGADGLRLLGNDPKIALILLDLDMPGIDGRRFRSAQCSDARLAGIPTVVVTGTVVTSELRTELHATEYLRKPVVRADFIGVVERYCQRMGDTPLPEWHSDNA